MDGRGGCCIARYGGGNSTAYDTSKIDMIMLRYRPIAPKPAVSGAVSGESKAVLSSNSGYVKTGRGRRRKNLTTKENSKSSSDNSSGTPKRCRKRKNDFTDGKTEKLSCKGGVQDNTVVTLPLLPESPDLTATVKKVQKAPVWLSFDGSKTGFGDECYSFPAVTGSVGDGRLGIMTRKKIVVGSWVIVESVTDTWGAQLQDETLMLEKTDDEKKKSLEDDTCPGFISDCWNRVWWTNKAYKKMAKERGSINMNANTTSFEEEEVVVWLVMREKPPATSEAFTCRVTVQSSSNGQVAGGNKVSSATLPCDVWRLSDGGFAWRLDVKAALSLGR